mmetsp:Transcript_68420/g.192971  ORF Transcript_68420/g.192971 Transcript_68420/m.192971 type:complete len:205 (+) Transcript_68420:3404-4018(+)
MEPPARVVAMVASSSKVPNAARASSSVLRVINAAFWSACLSVHASMATSTGLRPKPSLASTHALWSRSARITPGVSAPDGLAALRCSKVRPLPSVARSATSASAAPIGVSASKTLPSLQALTAARSAFACSAAAAPGCAPGPPARAARIPGNRATASLPASTARSRAVRPCGFCCAGSALDWSSTWHRSAAPAQAASISAVSPV